MLAVRLFPSPSCDSQPGLCAEINPDSDDAEERLASSRSASQKSVEQLPRGCSQHIGQMHCDQQRVQAPSETQFQVHLECPSLWPNLTLTVPSAKRHSRPPHAACACSVGRMSAAI